MHSICAHVKIIMQYYVRSTSDPPNVKSYKKEFEFHRYFESSSVSIKREMSTFNKDSQYRRKSLRSYVGCKACKQARRKCNEGTNSDSYRVSCPDILEKPTCFLCKKKGTKCEVIRPNGYLD